MKKKVVLVTGASRGIGKAIAEIFVHKNYHVVLNCKNNITQMNSNIEIYKKINPNVLGIQADVSSYIEVEKMFSEIITHYGQIDVLVNNAGISDINLFTDLKAEDFHYIMNTNSISVMNCSHLAVQNMLSKKSGSIINISSIWGTCGASCEVVYSASKGAVDSFTKALAKELAPSGIRVNAIACGVINTEMNQHLNPEEKISLSEEIPLMRFGEPSEIAELVLFLAEKKSAYITGQVIKADGGFL